MSTELTTNGQHKFALTRFYGGAKRGACVQVTTPVKTPGGWIQVSRAEARALAQDLLRFADKQELPEY